MSNQYRTERDSMGDVQVPKDAVWGAQTQRAVENFPISGWMLPPRFISALAHIKAAAADANCQLGLLDEPRREAIVTAADAVSRGEHDAQFPIDVFQTGSGTSSNMNANEVISRLASTDALSVHPNDHVNMSASSNDTIPTALHVSAVMESREALMPAVQGLSNAIGQKAEELKGITLTGRTHLMDAMPVSFDQVLGGWKAQVDHWAKAIDHALEDVAKLAQGGTAVGTGINADPRFGGLVADILSKRTGQSFSQAPNLFQSLSGLDAIMSLSSAIRGLSTALVKIANDLRWQNSGPLAGIGDIELQAHQPGSSIMPGKVNPVIPEATLMAAAQIAGHDTVIATAAASGNFQLNVMLPVTAWNILWQITIATGTCSALATKAIATFKPRTDNINQALSRNPILITALNREIGYDKAASIAKAAYASGRPVLDVAKESCDISEDRLKELLDPASLTTGGIKG